ncbi:hypothetical protein [Ulvibacterium sp.]|uniref:hypothetical protein n=1 Tax=Ulvibacterium sp. TaxID=2665914 RepID=UPI00261C78B4|nr:hypothetical protein [Ulvibacterium sp.]
MKTVKKVLGGIFLLLLGSIAYLFLTLSDEFKDQDNPVSNSPSKMFDKSAIVFDAITIYGTNGVTMEKLVHAAHVAAQWLDNDENGQVDDKTLRQTLEDNKATVVMSKDGFSGAGMAKVMASFSGYALQDLYAEETNNPTRRDASQEEIHHIVLNAGWQKMLPAIFSEHKSDNSKLYRIWKYANDNGYYSYDDPTCNDGCKTTEFFYLATAAYLDSQADLFLDEMRLKTVDVLKEHIPEIFEIFESNEYVYPLHKWPDGQYTFRHNIKYLGENAPES